MFHKILLPIDLSERHGRCLQAAVDLARESKGTITLLHVIEIMVGLPLEEEKTFYGRLEKKAHSYLERLGQDLDKQQVHWQALVCYGHRGPEIVRRAEETGSDLIVLTAPRIDLNNPGSGWGSLSFKVAMLAACPVLLVK